MIVAENIENEFKEVKADKDRIELWQDGKLKVAICQISGGKVAVHYHASEFEVK